MAASVQGVLGSASNATVGTFTVFTCPTGYWAKGRFMIVGQNAAGAATLALLVNGATIATSAAFTASHYVFSHATVLILGQAAAPTGASAATTAVPYPVDYYLDEGDLIQYTIGTAAMTAMQVQFVGVINPK